MKPLAAGSYLLVGFSKAKFHRYLEQLLPHHRYHPNLLFITPQPVITIDQIRHIRHFLALKNYQPAAPLVVALLAGEKMTLAAQNAFLKILEEPGEAAIILIQVDNQERLLATIRSRCQLIRRRRRRVSGAFWQQFLKDFLLAPPQQRRQLLRNHKVPAETILDNLLLAGQRLLYQLPAEQYNRWGTSLKMLLKGRQMLTANLKSEEIFDWLIMNL